MDLLPLDLPSIIARLSPAQQDHLRSGVVGMLEDTDPHADYRCECWADLVQIIERFAVSRDEFIATSKGEYDDVSQTWAFRGQARASWALRPSFDRFTEKIDHTFTTRRLVQYFKAKARLYGEDLPDWGERVEWFALMQHHGVPTRLLDFTYSPYIAIYFALQDPDPTEGYAMVWAVETEQLWKEISSVRALLKESARKTPEDLAFGVSPLDGSTLDRSGYVVPIEAKRESMRLSNQQGLFLVNGAPRLKFEESLRRMLAQAPHALRRIAINRSMRDDALGKLLQMNIHHLSLFPDLDGLAQFVKMKAYLKCARRDVIPEL